MVETHSVPPPFGKSDLINLLCLCVPVCFQASISSINGPLYPPMAESKDLTPLAYSVVFGFTKACMFIFCPIFGVYMGRIGIKRTLICGIFIHGLTSFLFGFLTYINSSWSFLVLSLLIRGVEGISSASLLVCIFAVFSILFEGRTGTTFGILQVFVSIGICAAPLIGTYIDTNWGYTAAFGFFGVLQMITSLIVSVLFPNIRIYGENINIKDILIGYWNLLKVPSVILLIYVYVIQGGSAEFLSVLLEPDLQMLGLSKVQIGFTFFFMGIPLFASPLWGWILDKMYYPERGLLIGSIIIIPGIILFGPFPGINPSYTIILIGLILIELATGLYPTCAMVNLRSEVIGTGIPVSMLSNSFLSIAFLMATSFGATVSPPIAGALFQNFGIQVASLFLLFIYIIQTIWSIYYVYFKRQSITSPETSRLLF